MILDSWVSAAIAEFVKVRDIGTELQNVIDRKVAERPELADEAAVVKSTIAAAIDAGTFVPTVTGSLMGALTAFRQGHGEVGKHTSHMG